MQTKARPQVSRYVISLPATLLALTLARADSAAPPAEFWLYLAEFADDRAEIFDPADFALMANLPRASAQQSEKSVNEISNSTPQKTEPNHGDHAEKTP